jgi:hypothetical protein
MEEENKEGTDRGLLGRSFCASSRDDFWFFQINERRERERERIQEWTPYR